MSGEFTDSNERLIGDTRRKKIAMFISDILKPVNKTLGELEIQSHAVQEFESREYQLQAWDALWQAREAGSDRGLVHLATGLGKTSVAVFDYAKFRADRLANGERARGLFVVHQTNILQQANERFAQVLPDIKRTKSVGGRIDPSADVTFATFQSLTRNASSMPVDAFDYIIYDEAHHIEAKSYKKVVEHFQPTFQLGLTATPERMDDKRITDHFGEAVYSKSLPEALAEGYLASVKYTPIYDEAVIELIDSGFSPEKLARLRQLLEVEPRNEEIVSKILEAQQAIRDKEGKDIVKTIIFCADIEHANDIANLVGGTSYHSAKDGATKDNILNRFRGNGLETITVRDMFNEGVDIPDARLVVFLRTTQSKTIYEQQLGRGLRKSGNKINVDVLDFVANIERLDMVYTLATDVEEAKDKEEKLDEAPRQGNESAGVPFDPFSTDGAEFIFSTQMVKFLEHYHYLVEQQKPYVSWANSTKEELIALALDISPETPFSSKMINDLSKERKFPNTHFINDVFGSLAEFHRACGFEVKELNSFADISAEEAVEIALRLSPDKPLGNQEITILSRENKFAGVKIIQKLFGTVSEFQRACGFEVAERINWGNADPDEIINLAIRLSPNAPLAYEEVRSLASERKFPSNPVITKLFGSLTNFQRACGFEVNQKPSWKDVSNDEIIKAFLEISTGSPASTEQMREYSKTGVLPSPPTIVERFGSMKDFFRACGFEVSEKRDWSTVGNEEIVRIALEESPNLALNTTGIARLSKENKMPSMKTINKIFGSLEDFQQACGFSI